jgi:low affinity Fe/Cu permease
LGAYRIVPRSAGLAARRHAGGLWRARERRMNFGMKSRRGTIALPKRSLAHIKLRIWPVTRFFTALASRSAAVMGHPLAFIIASASCVIWAVSGPIFHYSDTWQLVINTATTVLTFLAVFLIQNSQNRDGAAIQAKLDELLRAVGKARPEFIGIEHLTDKEICAIREALEREAGGDPGAASADASVDELLARRTGTD